MDRPADCGTVTHMPRRKAVKVPSSSNEAQSKTVIKVSKPAGGIHASHSNGCGKWTLKEPRRNGPEYVTPHVIYKRATTPKINSAVASTSVPIASKYAKPSSTMTGLTSSATFSKMHSTSKSVPVSRILERERGTASKAKSILSTVTRSTRMHEATCSTHPSSRNKTAPRCAETGPNATFQNKGTSVASPKGLKHGSETVHASKTARMKNSLRENDTVGAHADKKNPPAAPHPKTTSSAESELKKQHKEPSRISAETKQSETHPKVGLNQLIIVAWEGKQQVYCQLCSVRLRRSDHPLTFSHQYNYVKMKYPGWTATPAELEKKLNNIIAHLAEVEKNVGSQNVQRVEVKKDVYQKLALLPEDKAVEKVKAMVRPRDRLSSPEDTAEGVRRDITSPCEVSSSNDEFAGVPAPSSEMPGFSAKSQLTQETKTERQKLLDQITEMKTHLTAENDLAVYRFIRGQSLDGDLTQVADLTEDQLRSSISLNRKNSLPILAPSSQALVMAEPVKQEVFEPFEPDGDAQPHREIIPVTHTPETVKREPFQPCIDAQSHREITRVTHTPETVKQEPFQPCIDAQPHREITPVAHTPVKVERSGDHLEHLVNPDHRQEQKSDPASWEAQRDVKSKQKLTPSQINSPRLEAITASAEQLDPPGPSHSAGPREPNPSQDFTVTSAGRKIQGCSHLSIFLKASPQEAKPIIGMGLVWECRGMSLETFFLCESCEETLLCRDICRHMASPDHQLKYIGREHPEFLQMFWNDESLPFYEKMNIVQLIVKELSERERFHKVDAQCVLLGKELHQFVKTSSFCEALKMVNNIKDEEKPTTVYLPINTSHQSSQQPENRHNLFPKGQTAHTVRTEQRCDSAIEKMATSHSEKMSAVGGLVVKGVQSHLDANCSSVKAESVSPVLIFGTCLTPQETCGGVYLQPEFKPAVPLLPKSDPLLHVNKVTFESTCLSSTTSQYPEVCPRNGCPPSRKRPADKSEDPLPAKCISNPVQVKGEPSSPSISEFPSVYPDVNSPPLSLKHQDTESNDTDPAVDWKLFSELISELKKSNFQVRMSPSESAPDNPINPCVSSSSKTVASRWDSKIMKNKSEAALNKRRWDSKCQLVKGMKTEALVDLEDENK